MGKTGTEGGISDLCRMERSSVFDRFRFCCHRDIHICWNEYLADSWRYRSGSQGKYFGLFYIEPMQ